MISSPSAAADGQGIAVTTLLHPATAHTISAAAGAAAAVGGSAGGPARQAQRAQHEHVEPLGAGMCSFQLASPPCAATLRLMRALLQQLDRRLCLEAAEGAAAAAASAGRLAGGAAAAAKTACCLQAAPEGRQDGAPPALRGPAATPVMALAGAEAGVMPADCFWASF